MAGIFERIALMFKSKAHKTLDKYEDPRETCYLGFSSYGHAF